MPSQYRLIACLPVLLAMFACGDEMMVEQPMEAAEMTNPGSAAAAATIDFGDDASEWANDFECDDPRFQGPGMTATPLLDSDIRHDATDCRTAFEQGRLQLRQ